MEKKMLHVRNFSRHDLRELYLNRLHVKERGKEGTENKGRKNKWGLKCIWETER
jgi:hypothetical protein